jgi:ribosomal protein L11 methyltransferase
LGAASVEGIDIEEWAVENAIENAERNGVTMPVKLGGAEQLVAGVTYDVFLANINRNILVQDMDHYCKAMHADSRLLLSGFLEPDVSALKELCASKGLTFLEEKAEDNWRCLIFKA